MTAGQLYAGQFTQTDPLQPSVGSPYPSACVYGNNNPLVFVDPSGLQVVTTGGPNPAKLVGNEGQNIVSRQRQMILSTASKYGLMAELPAAILLGENDFRPIVADQADFLEELEPKIRNADERVGVANLHSWDAALIRRNFSDGTLDNEIASVDPTLRGKSLKEVLAMSRGNEALNVKLLVLAMASTSKEFAGKRQGKPSISVEKALLLARKTGWQQAQYLLQGQYERYNIDIAQNFCGQRDFDCRRKLLVSLLNGATEPAWLKQYGPYRATSRKLLNR